MNTLTNSGKNYLISIIVIVLVFQIVGTVRYIMRLPNDWLGIGLYLITVILFTIVLTLLFTKTKN